MKPSRCLCFFGISILLIAGMAYAQAPTFDSPVLAYRDDLDVVLEWDASADADGYNIYRFEDLPIPSPLGTPLAVVTGLSYRDQDAVNTPPDRYYYLVSAFNATGETPAQNLAFKLNMYLHYTPGQMNRNYISLPYLYIPNGEGVPVTSVDLCAEVDRSNGGDGAPPFNYVSNIQKGSYENCAIQTNPCTTLSIFNFDLIPGQGYVVVPTKEARLDLVGSHDPDLHPGGAKSIALRPWEDCWCTTFNSVAIPYHTTAETAEDICTEMGAAESDIVARFAAEHDMTIAHLCGSSVKNFSITPGESLIFRTHAVSWQPDVHR
jgi:hypothetical protein